MSICPKCDQDSGLHDYLTLDEDTGVPVRVIECPDCGWQE